MKIFRNLTLILLGLFILQNCAQKSVWYKGNTHAHTVICGHADSPPEVVAAWYHDHGYNFLILSEHNHFIDPDSVSLPQNPRTDFILIPGEEVSGPKIIHSTAMNIDGLVTSDKTLEIKARIIQDHVDITRQSGGKTILNHPNYRYAVASEDIMPVKGLVLFELYNGHPLVENAGDSTHQSTEKLWDELLTHGMKIFAVSSDDTHYFVTLDSAHSNPGRGWVMVKSPELSAKSITEAMITGSFYASNGVILKECGVVHNTYRVQIDALKTAQELNSPELSGMWVDKTNNGFRIEFIGPNGLVLSTVLGSSASFSLKSAPSYVRPRISFSRSRLGGGSEVFYAWGQPVFNDERQLQE